MASNGFRGLFEHQLDDRGRLAIPARYRARFEKVGIVMPGPDGSIDLYTPDDHERVVAELIAAAPRGRAARQLRRALYANAFEVPIDRQGRIVLPLPFRESHQLGGATVIAGNGECLEIWSAERWQAEQQQIGDYADLLEPAQGGGS